MRTQRKIYLNYADVVGTDVGNPKVVDPGSAGRAIGCCRWGNTLLSMSWAGQHMKVVEIDSYGRFPFVLVRVSDRTKVQRLLVRGRNNATKEELMKDVKRQVSAADMSFQAFL